MNEKKKIEEDLTVVVETVERQARAAGLPRGLQKPDFWTVGYVGGGCTFFLTRGRLKVNDPLFHYYLVPTFTRVFGVDRGHRLAHAFLTFLSAPQLFSDIQDFDRNFYSRKAIEKSEEEDFLKQVRGIYRTEVFEKFFSLFLSINEVIADGTNQAETDFRRLVESDFAVQPRSLMEHILASDTGSL